MQIIEDSLDQLLKQVAIRTNAVANREAVEKSVREIIANVIKDGDQAVKTYEKKFDNVDLDNLKVSQAEIDDAYAQTDQKVIDALNLAKENIVSFHKMEVEDSFIDAKKKASFVAKNCAVSRSRVVCSRRHRCLSFLNFDECDSSQDCWRSTDRDGDAATKGRFEQSSPRSSQNCRR